METSLILEYSQVFSLLLLSLATSIIAQEAGDDSFNYIRGDARGPENWGNVKQEWEKCKTGTMQSPIFIFPRIPDRVPESEKITRFYQPGPTTLRNRGHDISLEWKEGGGFIRLNGSVYNLIQCHWHSPSEHAINGRRYPLEAHFVHQGPNNTYAVIGFLYDYGCPDPFLSLIEPELRAISNNESAEIMAGIFHPSKVRMEGDSYYRYMGSLTTPPCNETVTWTVETKIGTVSFEQVLLLRDAVNNDSRENARPLQSLNGRRPPLYDTRLIDADEETVRIPYAANAAAM